MNPSKIQQKKGKISYNTIKQYYTTKKNYKKKLRVKNIIPFQIKRNLQTKSLQEHCRMCPLEDLSTIFYKVEEIKQYHQTFVQSLQEKVNNWSDEQKIGEIFKELVSYFVYV